MTPYLYLPLLLYPLACLAVPQPIVASASISSSSVSTTTAITTTPASTASTTASTTPTASSSSTISACSGNSATDRSTWCDYDLSTNYYEEVPETGVTREYWLVLSETTAGPDGYERFAMLVNDSLPGPTLYGDWGDNFIVHVTNGMTTNGTSIHFHGIRQNYTNQMDGVSSITQCPIAPGETYTYKWRATQYGTSWYHSHFALQAWEGVFGGILINGPASANYDNDLGVLFLNDWSHQTVDELYITAQSSGPPTLDNGLINGTNTFEDGGTRFAVSVTSDSTYRLRLINGALDTHFKFMIDNHTMTVISNDLVPIQPYEATVLNIGMGQRYDVVVSMDQAAVAEDFWIRAVPQSACSDNDNSDDIKGILHYDSSTNEPSTSAYSFTDECIDEDADNLVPYLSMEAGSSSWTEDEDASVGFNSDNLFRWYMNDVSMVVNWDSPTLLQIYENDTDWSDTSNVVELSTADEWAYIVVETGFSVPHPIHLHGHDFYILATGTGSYNSSIDLVTSNPPRRDVAMLPASGHLVMAFKTDNPGAWLAHCHIGWHTSEGFDMQFVERVDDITYLLDSNVLSDTCDSWSSYAEEESIEQDDSGV